MSVVVKESDLRDGDVFLFHGKSFIGGMIRFFEMGKYNHAAIYSNGNILEAVGEGVVSHPLSEYLNATEDGQYIDVFRFRDRNGAELGSDELPFTPVGERIEYYMANRERYAFEQLILLAIITATRKTPLNLIPGVRKMMRIITDSAAAVITDILDNGKEPMICSELVFRCFMEAGLEYKIRIKEIDFNVVHDDGAVECETEKHECILFKKQSKSFLNKYLRAKKEAREQFGLFNPEYEGIANYVTPKDLSRSPSLNNIGRLSLSE